MQVHKTVGIAKIPILSKRLNVIMEPLPFREAIEGVEVIPSYETFKQRGSRLTIGLQNGTREKIVLKKGTRVARVTAANVVPTMFAPDPSTEESVLKYMNREQTKGPVLENEKMNSDENSKWPQPMPKRLNEFFCKARSYWYHRLA